MQFFFKKIVGLDFHDYSAQVVELRLSKGEISLEAYNRIVFPPGVIRDGEILKPQELRDHLKNLLRNTNPKPVDTKNVAIILPSSKVFTHIFRFPSNLSEDEVKRSLPFEAETVIPFSIQDVYFDYSILGETKDSHGIKSRWILFAAIGKETVDSYIDLLRSIGLTPTLAGIDAESLQYGLIKQSSPDKVSLVIDIGTLSTNYLILQNSRIRHFVSDTEGGQELIAKLSKQFEVPESVLIQEKENNAFKENRIPVIQNFIEHNYKVAAKIIQEKSKVIKNVDEIFLTGDFLNLPNFYATAQKFFPDKIISIGDPRKYLNIETARFKPPKSTDDKLYYSTYFINAVGVALRGLLAKTRGISLLPESIKKTVGGKRNGFFLVMGSVFMALISLIVGTFIFFKQQTLSFQRLNLEIKKSSVDQLVYGTRYQEIRDEIERFNNEVNTLSSINKSLFSVSKMIEDIYGATPQGITITNFQFSDSELTFELSGVADTRETLLAFNKNLKDQKIVKNLDTPISSFDEKYDISFTIKLELSFKELEGYGADANI